LENLANKGTKLRKGSRFKEANSWVNGVSMPAMPTRMLSNVTVYESWQNPKNIEHAKDLLNINSSLTFRELIEKMFETTESSYIWWLYPVSTKVRTIHEDANGFTFVKMNNKWQMVYSIKMVGGLVGAQGVNNCEDLPLNSYFVSWENEDIAKSHAG